MKITLTIERKNKNKKEAEPEREQPKDDIRIGTGFIQNANAPYTAKSHRAPRTLGFH